MWVFLPFTFDCQEWGRDTSIYFRHSSLGNSCVLFVSNKFVSFFLSRIFFLGANINAQTEETQETALTLACCGGFLEVADFIIKAGADIELGCSTPLMEAAQEGHLELVKYLLAAGMHFCIWEYTT